MTNSRDLPTIAVPRSPEAVAPSPFPVLASIAPVVASVGIWAFTQSPFAMVFALLGPVIALASLGDSRRQAARGRRRQRERFERELDSVLRTIAEAHEAERAMLRRRAPDAATVLGSPAHDPERWRGSLEEPVEVTLGAGRVRSRLVVEGRQEPAGDGVEEERVRAAAEWLEQAPVVVDARLGIGVCGPLVPALAAANALIAQLANLLPPDSVALHGSDPGAAAAGWMAALPHWSAARVADGRETVLRVEFRSRAEGAPPIVIAVAAQERELPRACRVVLRLGGAEGGALVRHPDPELRTRLVPEFVSAEQGHRLSRLLGEAESASGRLPGAGLPDLVPFSSLRQPHEGQGPAARARDRLPGCVGAGVAAPVVLDLVADGPHAIVGGTTGSGKSELLVTWMTAMAAANPPDRVTFLLVDFKGGASFGAVRELRHTVGLVTDLDAPAATRALESLRAELRHRERVLARHSARSIEELGPEVELPRLVIAVDEFATLVSDFPELHELFADLAARGRSLGVHLILCTQRPSGSIRDSVLANCTLRICLRVVDRADSVVLIGCPDAADLPRRALGRAILVRGGGERELVQFGLCGRLDVEGHAFVNPDAAGRRQRRPWLDPLPDLIRPEEIPAAAVPGLVFGMADLPEQQRQEPAVYHPPEHGNLLVVGRRRSGRSGALAALGAATDAARWVPPSVAGAWDLITGTLDRVRSGQEPSGLLLFDDADILLGRLPPDHEAAFLDALGALLREGAAAGLHLVIAASPSGPAVRSLAPWCESRLILSMPDRQDHLLLGGSASDHDPALPPGAGRWNGTRVQVAYLPERPPREQEQVPVLEPGRWPGLAVVSTAPGPLAHRLAALGSLTRIDQEIAEGQLLVEAGAFRVILGDPVAWQSSWGVLAALKPRIPLVFHACSVAEFRALSGSRALPPPLDSPAETVWLLTPEGALGRMRLPTMDSAP